jgi:hypothetical protein
MVVWHGMEEDLLVKYGNNTNTRERSEVRDKWAFPILYLISCIIEAGIAYGRFGKGGLHWKLVYVFAQSLVY